MADAFTHPARDVAIAAIDRLATIKAPQDLAAAGGSLQHDEPASVLRERLGLSPEPDWYDGKPKRCSGIGKLPRVTYRGLMTDSGERLYHADCAWCGVAFHAGEAMPEHTFIPVRIEDWMFAEGKRVETFATRVPNWPDPNRSHNGYDGYLSNVSRANIPRDAGDPAGMRMAQISWSSRDPGFDIKIPQGQGLRLSLRRNGSDTDLMCWPLEIDTSSESRRVMRIDVSVVHDSGHVERVVRAHVVTSAVASGLRLANSMVSLLRCNRNSNAR